LLGGPLLVVPAGSPAVAVPPTVPAGAPSDVLSVVPQGGDRSTFRYASASGDTDEAVGFVSTGGTVRVQPLGENGQTALKAKTGAPAAAGAVITAAVTYRTTLRIDSSNWSAANKMIHLWNRDTWAYVPLDNPGSSLTATADLPPGNYFVATMYGISGVDSYLLTRSFTVTDRAQTVVLAQSSAKEVALRVDDTTARHDASAVWLSLPNGDLIGFAGGYNNTRTYVTTASTPGTTLRTHQILTKKGATALQPSPYRYDLTQSWAHPFPAALISTSKTASLARTTTTIRAQGINTSGVYDSVPDFGEWAGANLPTQMRLPATFVEYVTPGVSVSRGVRYGATQNLDLGPRTLPAGLSPSTTIGAGPLVPGRRKYNDDSRRYENQLQILENMPYGDSAGSYGYDYAAESTLELSADGQVLKTSDTGGMSVDVPARAQTYRLKQTHTRTVAGSQLATKVDSDWTFTSGSTPSYSLLDLMDLAVTSTGLDQRNRAGVAPVTLTVVPSTRRTAAVSTVRAVEWSTDDGATWTDLPFTASGAGVTASLAVPATAAFVSLRITADNDQGGKLTRTVQRAFAGPATGTDETTGGVAVSNVTINRGSVLNLGTSGTAAVTATFTASAPSGIAGAGLFLWHGAYNSPDGVQLADTTCTPVNATTANCSATLYVWDVRYLFSSNALAGTWHASAWATAKDGTGLAHRHSAGTLVVKRATRLVTANATPEPVKKGKTITITSTLTRADWSTGAVTPYANRAVRLQWFKRGGTKWVDVKWVKSNAKGQLKTTVKATADGYYRFICNTDTVSAGVTSTADYIDVR
jgi:hypothetical protein